ncbi:MAG: HGxxPAAW family protein [Micropruina sp.]|uniref:HGxxPAAW family protein n=1 Tax=Micropruina sp. TaxID=2737536 RepID=UPI0039E6A14B
MATNGKHYHHGRTPAAWTGSIVAGIGFILGTVAFLMGPNWVLFWISIAIILGGAVAGGVMRKMGLGQA